METIKERFAHQLNDQEEVVEKVAESVVNEDQGVEEYQLIFSKYDRISATEFKLKRMEDYVSWQRDMLRCYVDSFLIDDCIAGERVMVYCKDHQFKEKKKGKGKLKATFYITKESGEVLDIHQLTLLKAHKSNINKILDAHIYLLEMALEGHLNDPFSDDSPLKKFGALLDKPNVVKSTISMIQEIKNLRSEVKNNENQSADQEI